MMLNNQAIEKIKKRALQIDWDLAFKGKSKGNRHLLRITEIARFLAKKERADLLVVEAGALLHDTPLPAGEDSSYKKNKQIVKEVLKPFKLGKEEENAIAECVASHEGTVVPKTLEAKIVHDADVLEKSGILGFIRHTWKLVHLKEINADKIDEKAVSKVVEHLKWRFNRLQTKTAKNLHKKVSSSLNEQETKEIIKTAAILASQGKITEEIAKALYKHLKKEQSAKLKSQIDLSYLTKT